jgi:predicted RecB family endonuclease
MRAVGRAYAELGDVARELATVVERQDRADGLLPRVARKRVRSA